MKVRMPSSYGEFRTQILHPAFTSHHAYSPSSPLASLSSSEHAGQRRIVV